MFQSIANFFHNGGIFMIPLGLCSIVSVALIFERAFALRRSNVISADLAAAIDELRHGQSTQEIEKLSAQEKTVLDRLIRSCLRNMPWSKFENTEALQTKARAEFTDLERGLVILEIIVGIGPLLGLLGTVSGLITIFETVGHEGITTQGAQIAKGISEALITTVAGLVVAIPSLIAHSIFARLVERHSVEMENICSDFLGKIYTEPEISPDTKIG